MSEERQASAPIAQDLIGAFNNELMRRQAELRAVLPAHVTIEAFNAVAISAIRNRPELLETIPKTLWKAITQAAEDGLMPDGRQGVINAYWDGNALGKGKGAKVSQWMPMLFGIRKRAKELCGLIIDADVVCENDPFIYMRGDNPRIEHGPIDMRVDRGKMYAVYAIFRQGSEIVHREVLSREDVMKAKGVSRAQGGPMWTTFESEAWKKTAVRRGSKTVPMAPELERIVRRDDDHVDFGLRSVPSPAPQDRRSGGGAAPAVIQQQSGNDRTALAKPASNNSPAAAAVEINWLDGRKERVTLAALFDRVMAFITEAEANGELRSVLAFRDENREALLALWRSSGSGQAQALKIRKRISAVEAAIAAQAAQDAPTTPVEAVKPEDRVSTLHAELVAALAAGPAGDANALDHIDAWIHAAREQGEYRGLLEFRDSNRKALGSLFKRNKDRGQGIGEQFLEIAELEAALSRPREAERAVA